MCRDLFTDGFLTIAHLGTRPGGEVGQHNLSPRDIQHNTASRDIDRIYRQGELIARAFDNVKGGMQIGDDKIALKFREVSWIQLPTRWEGIWMLMSNRHKTTASQHSATPSTISLSRHPRDRSG